MQTTVIYHSADFDGIFCREVARKFLPDADLIGWNFGDPKIPVPQGPFYILDLPPECLEPEILSMADAQRMIWIDHHATSIKKFPEVFPGYRIDGVAACRLAWQWFAGEPPNFANRGGDQRTLPSKQDFADRKVSEPLAVRLAGEYDIWDKRDSRVDTLQYGLRCVEPIQWDRLLNADGKTEYLDLLLSYGRSAQAYAQKTDADLVANRSFRLKWEGLDFIVLNTGRFNSLTFAALDKPETGHEALMGFMWNGKVWTVSLYHANHRKDLDLSIIAVKYGGGGHRGACGFTCKQLPFL